MARYAAAALTVLAGLLTGADGKLETGVAVLGTDAVSRACTTLCCAMVLPGRKSAFRAGFWPD